MDTHREKEIQQCNSSNVWRCDWDWLSKTRCSILFFLRVLLLKGKGIEENREAILTATPDT
jgi:hypothetical protein